MTRVRHFLQAVARIALVCALLGAGTAGALPFSNLFVFGDSLSDAGNNALALGPGVRTAIPIPDNSFVPTFPYAVSDRYTNDRVWAEYLAGSFGLSPLLPSLAGGTDFAFGGADTGPLGFTAPPSLLTQVAMFLSATGGVAPGSALYVVAGGGNNARGALLSIVGGADPVSTITSTAASYAADVASIVASLSAAGAQDIIVWDTPDIGVTPALRAGGLAVSALGTSIAEAMNAALLAAVGSDPGVEIFDVFGLVDSVVAAPGAFGLVNASDACAQPPICDPSTYLFWDGIHPTSAGQRIIADAMLAAVPAPGTLLLLLAALPAAAASRRRWAA